MSHTASIADHIQSLMDRLKVLVQLHFHVVELHFYTIEERIVICRTRCDLVQCVHHLDDAVEDPLREDQAQISRGSRKSRTHKAFFDPLRGAPSPADQISEPLHQHTTAQHIGKTGNALAIAVAVLERL